MKFFTYIFICIALLTSGCAAIKEFEARQSEARKQNEASRKEVLPEPGYKQIGGEGWIWQDANAVLRWKPEIAGAGDGWQSFEFENRSSKVIKIIWDESSLSSANGTSQGIFPTGTNVSKVGGTIPPTILPPKKSLNSSFCGTQGVYHSNVQFPGAGGWRCHKVCTFFERSKCRGGHELLVTYEIDGKREILRAPFLFQD